MFEETIKKIEEMVLITESKLYAWGTVEGKAYSNFYFFYIVKY